MRSLPLVMFTSLRWVILGLVSGGLAGCGITVEPLNRPNLLISPDTLPPKLDIITNRPQLNLIPRAVQTEQAARAVSDQLDYYRWAGFNAMAGGSDKRYLRLQKIFSDVHKNSHMANEPLRAILVDRAVFQAYTKGGHDVIFYTGLTENLTDDELALVAGHEIAHIAAGHVAEAGSRDIVNTDSQRQQAALAAFYSIDAEVEADRVGLVYAALAGYDIEAASGLWDKLSSFADTRDSENRRFNLFTDTHPSHATRSEMLSVYTEDLEPVLHDIQTPTDKSQLLTCNPLYCAER